MNIDINGGINRVKFLWSQKCKKGNLSNVSVGSKLAKSKSGNNLVLTATSVGTTEQETAHKFEIASIPKNAKVICIKGVFAKTSGFPINAKIYINGVKVAIAVAGSEEDSPNISSCYQIPTLSNNINVVGYIYSSYGNSSGTLTINEIEVIK